MTAPIRSMLIVLCCASLAVPAAAQGPGVLTLCAGADRIVRFEPSGRCPAGQTLYSVARVGSGTPDVQTQLADVTRRMAALEHAAQQPNGGQQTSELSDLRARLNAVEQQLSKATPSGPRVGSTVVAPFTVTDPAGKPVFVVRADPRGFSVFDAANHVLAAGTALPTGGFFKVLNASDSRVVVVGAVGSDAVISLRDGLEGKSSRLTLAVPEDSKPAVLLMNEDYASVLALTQGANGGGKIQVNNAAGEPRLEEGVTAGDLGAIHAGPEFNCSGKMGLEVPDCIAGHK